MRLKWHFSEEHASDFNEEPSFRTKLSWNLPEGILI